MSLFQYAITSSACAALAATVENKRRPIKERGDFIDRKRTAVSDNDDYSLGDIGSLQAELERRFIKRRSMDTTVKTVKIKNILENMGNIYKRDSDWGTNFPDANGSNQSPINLNSREATFDPTLNETPLTINYNVTREYDIFNNGHTVVTSISPGISYKGESLRTEGIGQGRSMITGGPLQAGHEYDLIEFRFHWGRDSNRGSEHTVNLKAFPMELHLFHWNSTLYKSFEEAITKPNGIAIIALFIQVSKEHAGLRSLTEGLEDIQYRGRQKAMLASFNCNCLLPDPMLRDYWTYEGSLTIPPCTENVTWILFRYPLTVSHAQLEEFRRLKMYARGELIDKGGDDGMMVDNFRPTQPLNDRIVRASFQ